MKIRAEILTGVNYILTIIQTNELFQLIELILSILLTLFILASRIKEWFINSKKDGKIDKEEINDLTKIIKDGVDEIKKEKGEK